MEPSSTAAPRLWAKIEYDGTDFAGFQVQAGERTVQGELERALASLTGSPTRVVGAGRTDRGVHAKGQIVSFQVDWKHGLAELHRGLNAVVAADVAVLELGLAPEGFHPRFSARSRTYRYTILNQPWPSPLHRRTAWHVAKELDVGRMVQASEMLIGTQDMATFGRPPERAREAGTASTVRTVLRAEWKEGGSLLTFYLEANAFLFRMVRSIVGTLALVGWKEISVEEFRAMLEARDRSRVKRVAPAHGLCLVEVNYAASEGVSS
jgi:tRNA pseudouridine38-40 synthase